MKREFRKEFSRKRGSLSPEERREKDQRIYETLIDTELYREARSLFIFVSYLDEVNTHPIVERALLDGKRVLVPKISDGDMMAVEIRSLDELKPNKMGILEPESNEGVHEIDLCVTPGLAFDRKGYRMGYGGGYYDKFIAAHDMITLGIGYEIQWTEEVPHEDYDEPLNYFLSEGRFETLGDD